MSSIADALRRLARSERGMTVPMTLMVVVAGLGLGSAAVVASISAQRGTVRDTSSTRAIAAADAGAELALYRRNKIVTSDPATDPLHACIVGDVNGNLVSGGPPTNGWCPSETATDGSWTYQVKPSTALTITPGGVQVRTRKVTVVSVGTSNGLSRRISVTASAKTGQGVFGDAAATGVDRVDILGSSQVGVAGSPNVITNAATDGNITIAGSATLCGDAKHGIGDTLIPADPSTHHICGGSTFEGPTVMPPVDPGNVATTNDNGRICVPTADPATPTRTCRLPTGTQPCSSGNVTWCASAHTLDLTGNATLTLGGSNYYLCSLNLSGSSQLIVAQGRTANIFFGSPEACGLSGTSVRQINLVGNARITTTSQNSGDLRILMVGSDSIPTDVRLSGNSRITNEFTMYAPRTDVTLQGNPTYVGAVVGKTLTTAGNAHFLSSNNSLNSNLNVAIQYRRERYVECTGGTFPTAGQPDGSC
jgi:Tfp pilus assembly protein PilX